MDDLLNGMDRTIIRKLCAIPAQPLTEEELERYHYGNGLVFRMTKSWDASDDAIRAVVAMQTMNDLQKLVPRMIEAFEKLVQVEENRERREQDAHNADIAARQLKLNALWGREGLVLGLLALASLLVSNYFTYLMGSGSPLP